MSHHVDLPALRASHPVGYLAALGTLRLMATGPDTSCRLAWTAAGTPHAQLDTPGDYDAVVEALADIWRHQARQDAAHVVTIDDQPRPLPPRERIVALPKVPGLNDPAKLHATKEFPRYVTVADPHARQWAQAIGTDITYDTEREAISLTSLYLLSRQQRLDQQLHTLLDLADKADVLIDQALRRWRRQALKSGMNWDIRANRNAAESPSGVPETRIVPGATWLAFQALPLFPVTVTNGRPVTRGWQRAGRRQVLLMPCWQQQLGLDAVEVLLDHPRIRINANNRSIQLATRPHELEALGVHAVYAVTVVSRRLGGQTERYLDTAHRLTHA